MGRRQKCSRKLKTRNVGLLQAFNIYLKNSQGVVSNIYFQPHTHRERERERERETYKLLIICDRMLKHVERQVLL